MSEQDPTFAEHPPSLRTSPPRWSFCCRAASLPAAPASPSRCRPVARNSICTALARSLSLSLSLSLSAEWVGNVATIADDTHLEQRNRLEGYSGEKQWHLGSCCFVPWAVISENQELRKGSARICCSHPITPICNLKADLLPGGSKSSPEYLPRSCKCVVKISDTIAVL